MVKTRKESRILFYTKRFPTARDLNVVWHISEKKFKLALLRNKEP